MKKIGNTGSFKKFYLNDQIYVDKTEYIYNLINNEAESLSPVRAVLVNLLP